MSLEATLWAWDLDIDPVTKLVLLAIADYSGAEHTAWPSYETLSKRTCLDRRTIIRHCKKLEEAGHIAIHKRKVKKDQNASNVYQLFVSDQYIQRKKGSVSQSPGSVSQSPGGSVPESPKPPNIEPINEPIEIPKYFDKDLWEEYLKNRKSMKCKNTPRALKSLIKEIQKIEDVKQGAGMEALEKANVNGWKSVYPLNNKGFKQQAVTVESRKIKKF